MSLGILNVGAGDTKLVFDPAKPAERKRAAKTVTDMLRRGYAILVQVGEHDGKPTYQRAEAFDEKTCEYIIVGTPEEPKAAKPQRGIDDGPSLKTGRSRRRLAAERTSGVAVAPSAGG